MNWMKAGCLVICSIVVFGCVSSELREKESKAVFYLSQDGNRGWSGRLPEPNQERTDGPLASFEQVRHAIRELKRTGTFPPGGVTVEMREGIYPIERTLELTEADSGNLSGPVVYRAYRNEEVRLIGGREISGFKPVFDPAVLKRLDEACSHKIVQCDLKALGIENFGVLKRRGFGRPMYPAALELFFQDRPMTLARWPNEGWHNIADIPAGKDGGSFAYEGDRPKKWKEAEDIWIHGYWTYDWADSFEEVESIDVRKRIITTHEPGVYGYKKGQRFYVLNLLEELDAPGEWYLDRKTGILYFYPPEPVYKGKAIVSILETPFISMENVSNVTWQGLTLECTRGSAVVIRNGRNNLIAGCTFRNIGNNAVTVEGGKANGVAGCDIYETGDGGIRLNGGDRATLIPAGHFAENNHIYEYSRWTKTYRPAISMQGVGNRVSHNLIHNAPHAGILFGGNEHLIEYNEIHDICRETGDVGATYIGRDWTARGNVVRHNFFHHIHGPYTHGAMSVYLDDAASGTTIYGNVFFKASRAAFVGGGHDNIIENNIFVECHPSVHIDARSLGWAKKYAVKGGGWHMYDKLEAVKYNQPPYSTRYPELAGILENDPAVPRGNIVARNISTGGRWLDLQGVKEEWVNFEKNLIDRDPGFVNAGRMNFQLKDDSPAYELGFKKIPFEEIGLYRDEYRISIPNH